MRAEDLPEKITLRDSLQSLLDFGRMIVGKVVDPIDARYANAINSEEDEL